jgi:uncharacterized membrane protein YfcA
MVAENLQQLWLPLMAVFLLAGTIKGSVGIGLPTASVGMMSQFVEPRTAISLVVFPLLVTNLWQVLRAGDFIATTRTFRPFLVTLIIVLGLTTLGLPHVPTDGLMLALGAIVILFAISSLISAPPYLPEKFDTLGQYATGICAGLIGGLTSIWGPPMVIYLLARRTEKEAFIRALGTMLFLGSLPLAVGFWLNGMLTKEIAIASGLLTIPALVGFGFGEVLRRKLNAERFRTAVLVMFLIMGLNLLRRALF